MASAKINTDGEFEIFAITAGKGNGWTFSADTLKSSMHLWKNIETFIDHHWFGHSVHDLAGICHSPEWDDEAKGIKLHLRPVGPASPVLKELGRQMLDEDIKPNLGFSADIVFTAEGREVRDILRVISVDLVVNPARGGEFIRQIYQKLNIYREGEFMKDKTNIKPDPEKQEPLPGVNRVQEQIKSDKDAVNTLLNVQGQIA